MKVLRKIFLGTVIFLVIVLFFGSKVALGQEVTPTPTPTPTPNPSSQSSNIKDCKDNNISVADCPAFLQKKVNELSGQVNTLASQVAVLDNQVNLTEARIAANQQEITNLTLDIDTANKKIGGLEESLENLSAVLINRIKSTYIVGATQPFQILLSSNDASNFLKRLNYLKIAQQHDRKLIFETTQAKSDYENQKDILEDKKQQIETLRKQLDAYNAQLELDKNAKNDLLVITQNDERKYAALRDEAERELAALSGSQFTGKKEVKRGDVVGLMGNTGFSKGPHLHFGYYNLTEQEHNEDFKDSVGWYFTKASDPRSALVNRSLQSYDSSCPSPIGSGSSPWPLADPYITQCYGTTPYSSVYPNGLHDGLDMATNGSKVVTAAEDGTAYTYRGSTSFGNNVRIFHANGKMTLYLHLQ